MWRFDPDYSLKSPLDFIIRKNEAGDILVIAGGIIPDKDIPKTKKLGIAGILLSAVSFLFTLLTLFDVLIYARLTIGRWEKRYKVAHRASPAE
jgi:hypothetical protein